MKYLKTHPIISFYILAFALSWAGRVPLMLKGYGLLPVEHPLLLTALFLLGGAAPTLAALIVVSALLGRKQGADSLFVQFSRWRVGLFWYLAACLAPLVVMVIGLYASVWLLDGPLPDWSQIEWVGLPMMFLVMFFSYVWEEIGWRGFALPRMQERFSALTASLIMGGLAFLWHLPLSLNPDLAGVQTAFLIDLVFAVSLTVWFTWLYNNTGGSLLLVSLFHASLNVAAGLTIEVVGEQGFVQQFAPVTVLFLIGAVVIVLVYGPRRLVRENGLRS